MQNASHKSTPLVPGNSQKKSYSLCVPRGWPLVNVQPKIQYKDFDSDPTDQADAHQREDNFLENLGYIVK
jgi:hypothetical protein